MTPSDAPPQKSVPTALLVVLQTMVSAASLIVEIVAGRLLAPYVGMSLYTWTSIIAVVLAGFSIGHWIGGRLAAGSDADGFRRIAWSMVGAALFTGLCVVLLRWISGPVLSTLSNPVAGIAVLAFLVFFLPSLFAGVPAPMLAKIAVSGDASKAGPALGAVFAAGAFGAIAGTMSAGFIFISWVGSTGTLAAVTAVYVAIAIVCFVLGARLDRPPSKWSGGAIASMLAFAPLIAAFQLANPCDRESAYYCIRVVEASEDPTRPIRVMVLDHLGHGVGARERPDLMFTPHTAMLDRLGRERLRGGDASAFFIGGGSYSVPRAWAGLSEPPRMTVAEIDPEVTATARESFWFDAPEVEILDRDARRALLNASDQYDVIIGDAFTDIAAPAHLITEEFFRLVAARLKPSGAYVMNVVDHAENMHAAASLLATLKKVFPVVEVWASQSPTDRTGRLVLVMVASSEPTPRANYEVLAPAPMPIGRLSERWKARLLSERDAVVLTDDYAPIDRLMRWAD